MRTSYIFFTQPLLDDLLLLHEDIRVYKRNTHYVQKFEFLAATSV